MRTATKHRHHHHRHGEIHVTEHVAALIEKNIKESCPQRTDEWYKKRDNHLTASAMATACGANPYEKRSTLIKRKTGQENGFTGNIATEHGNRYEQEAIEKYEGMSGERVIEFGLLESMNHGEHFVAGSPDGITASARLIEVKCPFRRKPTSTVPDHYLYQVQTLMHILRLSVCDFIQYVPETFWLPETFIVTVVQYDPYFWKAKFPIIQRVWEEILDVRDKQNRGVFEDKTKADDGDTDDEMEDSKDDSKVIQVVSVGRIIEIKRDIPMLISLTPPPVMDTTDSVVIRENDGTDSRWQMVSTFFDNAMNTRTAQPPRIAQPYGLSIKLN